MTSMTITVVLTISSKPMIVNILAELVQTIEPVAGAVRSIAHVSSRVPKVLSNTISICPPAGIISSVLTVN
jgi:hypothetical protein